MSVIIVREVKGRGACQNGPGWTDHIRLIILSSDLSGCLVLHIRFIVDTRVEVELIALPQVKVVLDGLEFTSFLLGG